MGIAEIRGEKNGGGVEGVPDCLGQTNYAEICILVQNTLRNSVK